MKANGRGLVVLIAVLGVLGVLAGVAVLIHLPATQPQLARLHGAVHGAGSDAGSGTPPAAESGATTASSAESGAATRTLAGVAAIGRRWDAQAFAETVALYTQVHRDVEWPGVLEPDTIHYGPDARQTLELYRPEQGFSEPGPVFVFLHGNGLGDSRLAVPGSDGLIYSHVGKLAATFGGIGVNMDYRYGAGEGAGATLESGAEDLRLVIEWIVGHIPPYGGDPDTIVVLANSEGATTTAAYLFNEEWQTSSGPGVAAAILSSGLFGALAPEISDLADAYRGERVPLALWSGEFDTAAVIDGITAFHDQLCGKYGDCPSMERLPGHNHVSHLMSLGTPDTSVLNSLIRFYHTVR